MKQTKNGTTPKEVETYEKIIDRRNNEISINHYNNMWDRNEIIINYMFAFLVVNEIIHDDYQPRLIIESRQR